MRALLVASALLALTLVAIAPTASAADCTDRTYPPGVYGGVVGLTWHYAADSANAACNGHTDPAEYANLTCQWFIGLDCA
jgi:hypothetical protein